MASTFPHTIYRSSHGPCCFFQLIPFHQAWTSFPQIHQYLPFLVHLDFIPQPPASLIPRDLFPLFYASITPIFVQLHVLSYKTLFFHLPGDLNTFPICFKAWISNVLAPFSPVNSNGVAILSLSFSLTSLCFTQCLVQISAPWTLFEWVNTEPKGPIRV